MGPDQDPPYTAAGGIAMITLYGAAGSGSVAVEAALTLLGHPFQGIESETWSTDAARQCVAKQNVMQQVPTLVLPSGEDLPGAE